MPDLIKPFRLSCMQNMQTIGNRTYLYPTVYFGFSLLDPDSVLTEPNYLEVSTSAIPTGGFLDMGYPKRLAEVLIAGEARAPAGTTVQAREVTVSVGSVTKRAIVFGDRYWMKDNDRIRLTEPQPFESMPLTPERAFGNDKHPLNPVGKGCDPEFVIDQLGYAALPNIEDPRFPIAHPKDRPEPVLFGPLSHEHPLRKSKLGEPSNEWLRTTFPDPPPGFDRAYFNVAPADQRQDHAMVGDERVIVTGMSAENPAISTRLPGLRVRLFAVHDKQAERMTEIPVSLETVWIFGSAGAGGLYYRGVIPVADKEATDVVALLIGAERLHQEERPADYYAEVYRLRTDQTDGPLHTLNDSQLMPPMSEAELDAIQARADAYSEGLAEKFEKRFAWEIEEMLKESKIPDVLLPELAPPKVPRMPIADPQDILAGKVDLAKMMAGVRAATGAHIAQADAARNTFVAEKAAAGVPMPQVDTDQLKAAIRTQNPAAKAMFEQAAKGGGMLQGLAAKTKKMVEASAAETGTPAPAEAAPEHDKLLFDSIDQILAKLPGGANAEAGAGEEAATGDEEELFRIARARALALPEADPFYAMQKMLKESLAEDRATPPADGEFVSPDDALQGKVAPAPFDKAEMDADLQGLKEPRSQTAVERLGKLLDSLLPKAAAKGQSPVDALMKSAEDMPTPEGAPKSVDELVEQIQAAAAMNEETFFAELGEEERKALGSGDHERSVIPEAAFPLENYTPDVRRRLGDLVLEHIDKGESFARRDIAAADLSEADISHLDLSGVLMERANLVNASLKFSVFTGAALTASDLTNADASNADFSRAGVSQMIAPGARFDGAKFSNRFAFTVNFAGASFKAASFDDMLFQEGHFAAANFEGATFSKCLFFKCDLAGAAFRGATFERCMFMECTGAGMDFSDAVFNRHLFVKFNAAQSRWSGASLSRTAFVGNCELSRSYFDRIKGTMSSFLEANLDESCFMRADVPEFLFLKCGLASVDFRAARARRAVFNNSTLTDTDFFATDLMEAQLGFCDMRRASLRGANLYSANLAEAKVGGADLSYANLGATVLEMQT